MKISASAFKIFFAIMTWGSTVNAQEIATKTTPGGSALSPIDCRSDIAEIGASCLLLLVPENYEAPDRRHIEISLAVLKSKSTASPVSGNAVFFSTGGPGLSAIEALPGISARLANIRDSYDLVFIDQRGAGGSNPLPCPVVEPGHETQAIGSSALETSDYAACFAKLSERADLSQYTTSAAAKDMEQVRRALGYEQIDLLATSYGTALSLEYIRQYEPSVRSAFLFSATGPGADLTSSFAIDAQAALESLFADCKVDQKCNTAYPQLRKKFNIFVQRLKSIGGENNDAYSHMVRQVSQALYDTRLAAYLPFVISEGASGSNNPFASIGAGLSVGATNGYWEGLRVTAMCAEEFPFTEAMSNRATRSHSFLGDANLKSGQRICSVWPVDKVSDDFIAPVSADTPVLMVNGDLDPVTSPLRAYEAAVSLTNAKVVVARNMAHFTGPAGACIIAMFEEFLTKADPHDVDFSCTRTIRRPDFYVAPGAG